MHLVRSGSARVAGFAIAMVALLAIPASAVAHHGGPEHLPAVKQNMDLVGQLELTGEFGNVVPSQIADLAVHKGYAYLNSWDEPSCTRGGTYVADIRNPASPQEIGFIAAQPGYYHGEGAQVVTLDTPQFQGDLLAVNDEPCSNSVTRPPSVPADAGGFDLYDVTNPANPQPLVQLAGDRSPDGSLVQSPNPAVLANSYHSVFVWQDGNQAYLVGIDNTELADVDIYNITDPTAPEFIADFDLFNLPNIGAIVGQSANGNSIFTHDVVVKRIGGVMRMLVSYWDAGYVQLDVDNPALPTYITDTDFDDPDSLTGFDPPEGNAHEAEYSHDNQFFISAEEDFAAFRPYSKITQAPYAGFEFASHVSQAEPIADGASLAGDTVFVGNACGPVAPPPPGVTIAVAERGVCNFQPKADAIEDAGYDAGIIFNNNGVGDGTRCEDLTAMLIDPATVAKPMIFVGRSTGMRILGVFDQATYQCTDAAAPPPGDTPAPAVGTGGLTVDFSRPFDGWGYAHLYDAETSEELDAFAIPEALDPAKASGFGALTIHEAATDPATNLAYAAYYAGGMRVFQFSRANGLVPTGAYVDPDGSNFWGVEQFTPAGGGRLIAGSDRDFGLQIFRYTGPGAVVPPTGGGGGTPPATNTAPETTITKQPKKKSTKRKATFEFTSSEAGSTFECKLDKEGFKACASPFKAKVKTGKHTFEVRAIDAQGLADATPASAGWKVKKKKK